MSENERLNEEKTYAAACNIYQNTDSVVMSLEMPGVTKENLDIRIDKDLLIINGKRDGDSPNGKYMVHEIRQGDFHQEYTIDDTIDRNNINATIKNGVVTLTLGVKESEKPKKIKVISA